MEDKDRVRASALNVEALLEVVRATAQEGLWYAENDYDRARYRKLLELACGEYASITGLNADAIRGVFLKDQGSITPKAGVDVIIPNEKGEFLILQLPNGKWGFPGGWIDLGESPFDAARRETYEEAGLHITPLGYIAVAHQSPLTSPGSISQVNICVGAKPVPDGAEVTLSHEHAAFRWIRHGDEADVWRRGHKRWFPHIVRAYRDQTFFPAVTD